LNYITENHKAPKGKTKMGSGEVKCSTTESVKYSVELGAIECETGKVEVQWNTIKKCVLDTMSDLVV
jgi:hypothetical protein